MVTLVLWRLFPVVSFFLMLEALVWFVAALWPVVKQTVGACPLGGVGPGWTWVGSGFLARPWRLVSRLARGLSCP